jgi:acyl-coenzyme A thioesterase PaaI-like protein
LPESRRTRWLRWRFKFFPAWRGTGATVTYVAGDFKEVRVKLPLSWRTRNYIGTIFGGSLYAAVDPIYVLMLIHILGGDYVVWDKAASIRFRKPGRSTLYATFLIDDAELEAIRAATVGGQPVDRVYTIDLKDADGVVHATVEKVIYIRQNSPTPPKRSAST